MTLNQKHFTAMALEYQGKSISAICAELGITPLTFSKWRKSPEYKSALVAMATQQIGELLPEATATLGAVMRDESAKPSERINAAKAIFEYSHLGDQKDLEKAIKVQIEYL